MPPEDAAAVMRLAQRITRRQGEALGAAGVTIAVNDGRAYMSGRKRIAQETA